MVVQAAIAFMLLGLGATGWRTGKLGLRVADAHDQLALLQYDALEATNDDIEQLMGYARSVPFLTNGLLMDVEESRATAAYWQARYDALQAARDENGAMAKQEPGALALAAKAAYRTGERESADRQAMLRLLDAAVKSYADLLKQSPGDRETAYNYEYFIRQRDAVSSSRPVQLAPAADSRAGLVMAGDLPEGRTVHGAPGLLPPEAQTDIKIHVPISPEERKAGSDAGAGKPKIRKG
jgi:hypothetical protein